MYPLVQKYRIKTVMNQLEQYAVLYVRFLRSLLSNHPEICIMMKRELDLKCVSDVTAVKNSMKSKKEV